MATLLSAASRICIILLLLGGTAVTLTQAAGIVLDTPSLVTFAGESLLKPVCFIAGLAGILAFLRTYTKVGATELKVEEEATAESR